MNMINTPMTMTINDIPFPIHTGTIKPDWIVEAAAKGYDIVARVVDRLHLALRCHKCGGVTKVKRFTLMSAQPLCSHCMVQEWTADAQAAGLEFLRRDDTDRHYGIFRADCGHEVTRQFGFVKRAANGGVKIRCETCQTAFEVEEARERDWTLLGPDPVGDPSYRHYRHDACGHEQRMARGNVKSGRHACGKCSLYWSAAPSHIYAMSFTLASGRELVKLGYSNDPESRLHYQLKRDPDMPCSILRMVAVPTGQDAARLEKRLHAVLRRAHPDCMVDPAAYQTQIRVKSEIYDASLTGVILHELDRIETALSAI